MTWQLAVLFGGLALAVPLIWQQPSRALYVLIGAATVIEVFPLGYPDSLTDTFPFFLNLNNSAQLPVSISPAEIVMAIALAAWITSSVAGRGTRRPGRPLLRAYLLFMCVVLFGVGWGLLSGGDFNLMLWEVRPQVYGFVLFLLTASLLRERRQVVILATVFLAGAAFKAGIGYYRFFITLNGQTGNGTAILGHEDSYFLVMFLVAAVAAAIWVRRRGVILTLLALSPIVAITMLQNKRRVATLALWAAMVVVVGLAIRFEPVIRKRVMILSAVAVASFAIYVTAQWNATDGIAEQIVRPVRTLTGEVDQRDLLSDLYRINENADIQATYAINPVIGIGFGLPMLTPFPLADISQQYPLWNYIPHNSVLWIAMRMGVLGTAAFWALIGMIILEGIRGIRFQEHPRLRAAGAFALAAVVAELVVGYGDVQLENYRNMIFFGVMIGIIDALPSLLPITEQEVARAARWAPVPALSSTSHGIV